MKKKTKTIVCPVCRGSGKAFLFLPIGLLSMRLRCPHCHGVGTLEIKIKKKKKVGKKKK